MPNSVAPATFEAEMWQLLARHALPGNTQTSIGNAILLLARKHLGIRPDEVPRETVRLISGTMKHYFPGSSVDLSRCGRVQREQLAPGRITEDRREAAAGRGVCAHCADGARADVTTIRAR